jgi:hypothetical protein
MFNMRQNRAYGRSITAKFVTNNDPRFVFETFEQLKEKSLRCLFIPSSGNQNIENNPFLIDCSPEVMSFAIDFYENLIDMPLITRLTSSLTQLSGLFFTKLQAPSSNRFVADNDTPFSQQQFHITITEGKTKIEPDTMLYNLDGKTTTLIGSFSVFMAIFKLWHSYRVTAG